jgi:hypothetical protein
MLGICGAGLPRNGGYDKERWEAYQAVAVRIAAMEVNEEMVLCKGKLPTAIISVVWAFFVLAHNSRLRSELVVECPSPLFL